jgi:phage-related protein
VAVFVETIKLDDQVSEPAKKAGGALESAGKAMGGLSKATFDAANAMAVGKASIGEAISGIKNSFSSLAEGDVKGAVAGLTDSIAGMAKMLDLVVPGLGEAAAVVIQIAGGLVGITVGLIKSGADFAIASTQAKTQMLAMFDALGNGKITGEEVDDMLDGLSAKLGQTKDVMVPLVKEFAAMGITSKDALEKMTTAALSAKALVGGADSGAQAFEKLSKKIQLASETGQGLKIPLKGLGSLAEMGLTVDDVAKKMGVSAAELAGQLKAGTANATKFGDALQDALIEKGAGPLEKMGLGLANLKSMFQQYIGDMFEDMSKDIEPFMTEVKSLFSIFDSKSKPSGDALKQGIGAFFKQVFAAATKVVPMVKHFLLDIIIYGLKAYIAIKPIIGAIKEFASSAEGAKTISFVLSSLWEVLKVVGTSILVVVGLMGAMWAAMIAVSVAVWTAVGAFLGFVSEAGGALAGWVSSAATAAYDFIAGLVGGIGKGAGQVVDAVKDLASSATDSFKSALGIHSPSKVMMGLGVSTGAGVAEGIDSTADDVHGASSGLANAAVKGVSDGSDAPTSNSGPKAGANITVQVTIDGAGKSAQEITEAMVASVFERYALAAGV